MIAHPSDCGSSARYPSRARCAISLSLISTLARRSPCLRRVRLHPFFSCCRHLRCHRCDVTSTMTRYAEMVSRRCKAFRQPFRLAIDLLGWPLTLAAPAKRPTPRSDWRGLRVPASKYREVTRIFSASMPLCDRDARSKPRFVSKHREVTRRFLPPCRREASIKHLKSREFTSALRHIEGITLVSFVKCARDPLAGTAANVISELGRPANAPARSPKQRYCARVRCNAIITSDNSPSFRRSVAQFNPKTSHGVFPLVFFRRL